MSNNIGPYQQDFTNLAFFCDIANPKCFARTTSTAINNLSPVVTPFGGERSGTVLPVFSNDNMGYLTLDGVTNQYIDMFTSNSWLNSDVWTVSIWFRLLSTPVVGDVLAVLGQFTNTVSFIIDCQSTFFRAGSFIGPSTSQMIESTTTIESRVGSWTNIVASRDSNNIFSIYVNGEFENSATYTVSTITSGNFRVGYNSVSNYSHMDFSILQYYKRALGKEEIKRHFNAYRGRYGI